MSRMQSVPSPRQVWDGCRLRERVSPRSTPRQKPQQMNEKKEINVAHGHREIWCYGGWPGRAKGWKSRTRKSDNLAIYTRIEFYNLEYSKKSTYALFAQFINFTRKIFKSVQTHSHHIGRKGVGVKRVMCNTQTTTNGERVCVCGYIRVWGQDEPVQSHTSLSTAHADDDVRVNYCADYYLWHLGKLFIRML